MRPSDLQPTTREPAAPNTVAPSPAALKPALLSLLLLLPLSACRYNFFPPIPAQVPVVLPPRVTEASLRRDGEQLTLTVSVAGTFEPGYLSVVWFAGDRELARDSIYLDRAQPGGQLVLAAPKGQNYRALLSFGGSVLRQLELREGSDF